MVIFKALLCKSYSQSSISIEMAAYKDNKDTTLEETQPKVVSLSYKPLYT